MNRRVHCWKCGKVMKSEKGVYTCHDKYVGTFTVPYAAGELLACDCGEAPYVSAALSARVADHMQKRIEQLLLLGVGGDMHEFKENLMGMGELEGVLGVTRQAVWKSPKYRNHIYHVVMNGDVLWWKPSVKLFREKGDGRFVFGRPKTTALKRFEALGKLLKDFFPLRTAAMFAF